MILPKALEDLIVEFMKYPGVGRKTAERYALYTIEKLSNEDTENFSNALKAIKTKIHHCEICGHLTDQEICEVCSDQKRDRSLLLIVESPKDVFTIEKSGEYKGYYHVLNGRISPIDGYGPEDINLESLWKRISDNDIKEIIIATSSTQEGETTALYISRILNDVDITVSRIGYGVPVGLNLEYADDLTLSKAIENRKSIK
ncbi:recombination mediator RecR [Candidatus Izemoplasma sp. B36]|uniref:recombination mediator RecR n=1 Tax=Candidatus Izemoplasma sp. B36 TaxID=3242468 RepID=UPI0035588558